MKRSIVPNCVEPNPIDPLVPWHVDEAAYPHGGSTWERLSFCLYCAVLAPSGHNTQPWRFRLGLDTVKLYADRTRALPVVDAHDRELTMSCGAALFHLCLAIRYFGRADDVQRFPDAIDRDWLAEIQIGQPRALEGDEQAMFHAIPRRRTNRCAFEKRPLPGDLIRSLCHAAVQEDAALAIIEDEARRKQAAQFVGHGDRAQMASPSFRRELAAWIHSGRAETRDGIPG